MPSTYSPDLRIELVANGEQSGTWGTTTNNNLGTLIEDAIAGLASVSVISANQALLALNGVADQARCAAVSLTTTTTAAFSVYVPPVPKLYVINNASAYAATIFCSTVLGNTTAAGTGVAVPAGKSVLLRSDGTNIVEQLNYIAGGFTVEGANNIVSSAFLGTARTATINVATPAVITVSASPPSGTAVVFSTTNTLPTGLTAGTTYYVSKINATTFNVSTSPSLSPLVATSGAGTGTHTVATVSLALTPPLPSNNNQLATTAFVNQFVDQFIDTTNWAISETTATQTATITIASPAVVTVTTSPANGTAVSFSTTGALPTGITADQPYYVANRTSTTYNLASTADIIQSATLAIASPGVVTVASAPQNGDEVVFATTNTLPTGITAGTVYYVINRASTTFQVAPTSGGTAIDFTGSYTGDVTVASRTIINTSGSQSGAQTETTSKLYFKYKSINRLSLDLGGNLIVSGNITAYGTV
jgi:hypothetical protein